MLVLSLFPGIGLLDRAFEEQGDCVVRGPDVIWGGDIRRFHPPAGKFDGVIGGPPCQMFSSLARLVEANGHKPKFGNLIPEFSRCVGETGAAWFLMENVPAAPMPEVEGYGVTAFLLDNSMLDSGDGYGQEQRRVRRFCFGMRGRQLCTCGYCAECYTARENGFDARRSIIEPPSTVPDLRRWIDLATFLLPDANGRMDDGVKPAVTGDGCPTRQEHRTRPSEKRRSGTVSAGHMNPEALTERKRQRQGTVSSNVGGFPSPAEGRSNNGKGRYRLADACRLQGLPEDFLADAPFTADGKLKAVANGVPLYMGRAIARAILEALKTWRF